MLCILPVNSAMRVRSLTLPAPGHTLIPNFACKGFTMGLLVVVNYYNLNSSILKNFIKFFGYAKSHGSDYCCGRWSCHLHEQWICKKGALIFMRFSTKFWCEKHLYYGEIHDDFCLCKLSANQKSVFSFYD